MDKFYGKIGFGQSVETSPGVFEDQVTERSYRGDIVEKLTRTLSQSDNLNDNLSLEGAVSIVADPYLRENFYSIRYVHFAGAYWKISRIRVEYPRIILTIGGVYNGNTVGASGNAGSNTGG